jgi:hypothetical protein
MSPFSLKKKYIAENIKGVYIPYWSYSSGTESSYTGQAGDYYNTDEVSTVTVSGKTETKTDRVRKIRWRFISGSYDNVFKGIMYNDSGIDQKILEKLEPYRLNELVKYDPRFLTGFAAEHYKTGLKAVWGRAKGYMRKTIASEIFDTIERGCDVVGKINISTKYADINFKLLLFPVWISSYRFKGKEYNFYINGQTGEVLGKSPKSFLKISGIILLAIAVVAALYFILR